MFIKLTKTLGGFREPNIDLFEKQEEKRGEWGLAELCR